MSTYFKYKPDKDSKYPRCFEQVEVSVPPPEKDMVYVCTRSLYGNSLWGQIERCGWIEVSKLEPLDPKKKKDREIIERLNQVQKEGIERSNRMYSILRGDR